MKKTKLFLRTFFALFVVAMAMTISTVVAYATDYEYGTVTTASDGKTKTWDFTTNLPNSNIVLSVGDTVSGIEIISIGSKTQICNSSSYGFDPKGSTSSPAKYRMAVPENCEGKITLYGTTNQSLRYAYLESDEDSETGAAMSTGGSSLNFDSTETSDGYVDIRIDCGSSAAEYKTAKIVIKLTSGTFETATTYTVTGSYSGLESDIETFALSDGTNSFDVTLNNGTYTLETQSTSFDPTKTFTAVLDKYSVSYGDNANGVTLTATEEGSTVYTASPDITFAEIELTALTAGTYTEYARPNFDVSPQSGSSEDKWDKGTTLTFKVSSSALVTFEVKSGTSTSGNVTNYSLYNSSGIALAVSQGVGTSETVAEKYFIPAAGEYTFKIETTSTATCYFNSFTIAYADSVETDNGVVVSDGTDYYVIAYVSDTDLEDKTSLTLGNITTTTVYASATVNSKTYSKDSCHVYAVKIPLSTFTSENCADDVSENILNFKYTLNSESNESEA